MADESSTANSSLGAWLVIVRVLLNDCDLLTADETARAKGDGLELEYGFGTAKVLRVLRFNGAGWQGGKLDGLLLLTGEVEDSIFFPSSFSSSAGGEELLVLCKEKDVSSGDDILFSISVFLTSFGVELGALTVLLAIADVT